MILERTMHDTWLSNSYLLADRPSGSAVLIDSGGPTEAIVETIRRERLTLERVLCTHHHYDHVAHNGEYKQSFGCPVCGHRKERELFGELDEELEDGQTISAGSMRIRCLHVPGHTLGQLAFVVDENRVFTGDTLFRGSIGGTRAPGHTSFEDIQHSILGVLMQLPKDLQIYPGHMEASRVESEWDENPFIRYWRGLDPALDQPCLAYGEAARCLVTARDYDGGDKHQVRFEAGSSSPGKLDIIPGSKLSFVTEA